MTPNPFAAGPAGLPIQGDPHPLAECLGAGVSVLHVALPREPIRNASSLRCFLDRYASELLVPVELAVIHKAARLSSCSKFREIIELDHPSRSLDWEPAFSEASRRSGRSQLTRLRTLRELKGLRKYREAVERGEAVGAHTVVYGIMLGIYSIPLRQGLIHYAGQTMYRLAEAGADRLAMELEPRRSLHQALTSGHEESIRHAVESMLASPLKRV